ncbi:hypothetical protein JW711_06125 [Candidatus Woesearchaeota archaeon]|nr:hypothetical protein [Candidatus Woesearchaeota archaeon]
MRRFIELFRAMVLEEWRIHSTIFGNVRFALFPLIVVAGSFLACLSSLILDVMFSRSSMILFVHYLFFFFGANIGAFGMIGRESMNRRFGQASLVAYSSKSLPVGEREIFSGIVAKDIIYYFIMWIVPIVLGFVLATPVTGSSVASAPILLVSLTLAFLLGTSAVYLLSVFYVRIGRFPFIFMLGLIAAAAIVNQDAAYLFPPLLYFLSGNLNAVWVSLSFIVLFTASATIFASFEFPNPQREYKNKLKAFEKALFMLKRLKVLVAKDFVDLKRSQGGFGKVIFSFLLPMAFAWVFVDFVSAALQDNSFIILFSILLGIFSSTIYSWLTEYDKYSQYSHLPLSVSDLLKSKIAGYAIINLLSVALIIGTAYAKDEMLLLGAALIVFVVASSYSLSITMLYTGLSPSVRFMDIKVLTKYFVTIIPVMLVWIIASFFGFLYLSLIGILILAASAWAMKISFKKWDSGEEQMF